MYIYYWCLSFCGLSAGVAADWSGPSKSPTTPGIQPQSSFDAYVEEQYAITLALVGRKSMSSLTESQRAAVIKVKEGIRGPKPSRIPRRIPHSNVQEKLRIVTLQQRRHVDTGHQMKSLHTANTQTTNRMLASPGTGSCIKVPKRREEVRVVSPPSSSDESMDSSESFSSDECELVSPSVGGRNTQAHQECDAEVTEAGNWSTDKRVIRELNPFMRRDVDNGFGNRKQAQTSVIKAQQRAVERQEGQKKELVRDPLMRASRCRRPCKAAQAVSIVGYYSNSDSENQRFSVNSYSGPSNHLESIHVNAQLKGPKVWTFLSTV